MTIAYLNTRYPSLSHTFIEREVSALRARGVSIETFSIRTPNESGTLGDRHRAAAATTTYLLDSAPRLLLAAFAQVLQSPLGCLRALAFVLRGAPPGVRSRLTHIAYAAEALRLVAELRRRGLSHIHVHMANNGAAVALLATRIDPRLTYSLTIHGSAEFFHVDSWSLKPKVENAVFTRAISNFCRAQIMAWTDPESWARIEVVHCGVDTSRFRPAPRVADGVLRLLTVGRFHPIKGYPLLLEACARLSGEGVQWSLDMVGDGGERAALERLADRLGVRGHVTFSGAIGQDDIQDHFERADVMVISSFMEGVPVVLMEAMAKGLAVLTTAVGGVPEMVAAGENGEVVAPGSATALFEGLKRLHARRDEFRAMGALGRERIVREFDIEQTASGMTSLFRRYVPGAVTAPASEAAAVGAPAETLSNART